MKSYRRLFIALVWTITTLSLSSICCYNIFLHVYVTSEIGLMMAETYGVAFNCVTWLLFFIPLLCLNYAGTQQIKEIKK